MFNVLMTMTLVNTKLILQRARQQISQIEIFATRCIVPMLISLAIQVTKSLRAKESSNSKVLTQGEKVLIALRLAISFPSQLAMFYSLEYLPVGFVQTI